MAKVLYTFLLMLPIAFVIQNVCVEGNLSPWDCSTKVCPNRCSRIQYKKDCLSFCSMCCQKCSCPFLLQEKVSNKGSGEVSLSSELEDCKYVCEKSCGRGPVANKKDCLEKCNTCCTQCLCPFPDQFPQQLFNTRNDMSMLH